MSQQVAESLFGHRHPIALGPSFGLAGGDENAVELHIAAEPLRDNLGAVEEPSEEQHEQRSNDQPTVTEPKREHVRVFGLASGINARTQESGTTLTNELRETTNPTVTRRLPQFVGQFFLFLVAASPISRNALASGSR